MADGTAEPGTLDELVEEFVGWWELHREGSVNRTYDYLDKITKRLRAALREPHPQDIVEQIASFIEQMGEAPGCDWADAIRAKFTASALRDPPKAQEGQPDFWRCLTCGCLWRDNHDDTVSLGSAKQTSCVECEMKPSAVACEPLFRHVAAGRSSLPEGQKGKP